jgi:signal transduction histidine kinase
LSQRTVCEGSVGWARSTSVNARTFSSTRLEAKVGLVAGVMIGLVRIRELIVLFVLTLAPACLSAEEVRPRSVLVLDQSDLRGPFYYQIFSGLRTVVANDAHAHTTLYAEDLDLSRFQGSAYEQSLQRYLKEKYRDRPIGVIVAVGAATLELVLRWRSELWPGIPVVFAMVDEIGYASLKLPPDVTGGIVRLRLADAIAAARVAVPDLKTIVFVGDAWERQVIFQNWKKEISTAVAGLNAVEIIGRKMAEIRKRVAELPDDSAIVYAPVYSDGEGTFYPPATALSLIAEKANRPIVVGAETFLEPGGIGGLVLAPSLIGADAARMALRILDGESPSSIPPTIGGVKPIFNWGQMQRWKVSESSLPPGSEIRFREPDLFERYRWQSIAVLALLLLQAALIAVLLHERKRRQNAEVDSRDRMSELAHVNRHATAGELASSIAHELNQPLGSILTNAETAELILSGQSPDLNEVREILADIQRDDLRANEVIRRLRSFMRRTTFETRDIDLNELMRDVFDFLSVQAAAHNVALHLKASPEVLRVKGDPVQLQQVIINLIVNSMDAMDAIPYGRTVIGRAEMNGERSAVVSISDSGPGIPADKLTQVFDPFFTTKEQGMGIGLSIARTIILAHEGRIWAENETGGGAVFHVSLPLAAA